MVPSLASLPALVLPMALTSVWNWQIPNLDRAFAQLGAATDAVACRNGLAGMARLSGATQAVSALTERFTATATTGLDWIFDFQRLFQTPMVERCAAAARPVDFDSLPPAPAAPDPALRDELDSMWAELDDLREQVKARPPGDELRSQGF